MIKRYKQFTEGKNFDTKIVCAFPGCGKTTFFNMMEEKYDSNDICIDSDSSEFSWIIDDEGNKVRNPDFPNNYIKHIKENIGKYKYIFVSSHENVRDALIENNIPFYIVYPNISMKEEYLKRYKKRGNDDAFIKLLTENWENWIDAIVNFDNELCTKLELTQEKPFLADVLILYFGEK